MLRFWQSLRGKLILTYTLVTVLALLSLEFLILLVFMTLSSFTNVEVGPYIQDVLFVLPPQARSYLLPGKQDITGLQSWLEQTYITGKASLDAQGIGDSPAAMIVKGNPLYVLSPEGIVLAQYPLDNNSLVGRKYTPPELPGSQAVLDRAFSKSLDPMQLSLRTSDGNYWIAVPVLEEASSPALLGVNGQESGRKLFGVILVTVKPPPPLLWRFWPFLLGGVLLTGFILLFAVAPLGALFGFIMSRGLTRRLTALTLAADAWSEGDFSIQPKDRSRDEISYLGMRLRHMAERVQALLQTQHELAMLEERNRLARELHDTVKQQTFATLMQVRAAKNLLERDPLAANRHLEEAESLIKTAQHELGMMISELRPAALEGQGLVEALRVYLDSWQQHSLIPADFQVQNERRLPLAVEQALYRVAQEALSNVARHSRASQVTLRLEFSPAQVCLIVVDN
ncbi:MAG: histidine kinase, partial [Omnitrophica WOR_2 bacterium]